MANIEFGTFITAQANVAQMAQHVEALGYDVLGCGEHVMFYGPVTNSYISLAAAAGATSRIKLMSGIVLLPLYPAALAAKLGAALQVVSNDRYICGVGVGGEFPKEFEACGVPLSERGARTDEAMQVMRRLWSEDAVTFDGRFTTLNEVSIAPRSATPPPIWVAGRQEVAMRRAARLADGWLPYMFTPEQVASSIATIRGMAGDEGRDLTHFKPGIFAWSVVHEDGALARRMAIDMLSRNYSQDFSKIIDKYAIAGDPDYCKARLREYVEAGAQLAMLAPATKDEDVDASVTLMAQQVLPAFR